MNVISSDGAMVLPKAPPDPPDPPDPPNPVISCSVSAAVNRRSPPLPTSHGRRLLLVGSSGFFSVSRRFHCCDIRGRCLCFGFGWWPRCQSSRSCLSGGFSAHLQLSHPSLTSVTPPPFSVLSLSSAGSMLCTGEQRWGNTSFPLPIILTPPCFPAGSLLCTGNHIIAAALLTSSPAEPGASILDSWAKPIKSVIVCSLGFSPNLSYLLKARDGLLTGDRMALFFVDPANFSMVSLRKNYVPISSLWERSLPLSSLWEYYVKHSSLDEERPLSNFYPRGENTVPPCSLFRKGSVLPELQPENLANLFTESVLAFFKCEVWLSKSHYMLTNLSDYVGKSSSTHLSFGSDPLSVFSEDLHKDLCVMLYYFYDVVVLKRMLNSLCILYLEV